MARIKYDYFEGFKKLGEFSRQEAEVLNEVLNNFDVETLPEIVEKVHAIEHTADLQVHEIFTHTATEFLAPFDREDIAQLALRLDDIADYINDVVYQLYMYNIKEIFPPALQMAELIEKATMALLDLLQEFRNFRKSDNMNGYVVKINDLEEAADRVYSLSIRSLFTEHTDDPIFVVAWSNILLRLERCVDACEGVADILTTITLKHT